MEELINISLIAFLSVVILLFSSRSNPSVLKINMPTIFFHLESSNTHFYPKIWGTMTNLGCEIILDVKESEFREIDKFEGFGKM